MAKDLQRGVQLLRVLDRGPVNTDSARTSTTVMRATQISLRLWDVAVFAFGECEGFVRTTGDHMVQHRRNSFMQWTADPARDLRRGDEVQTPCGPAALTRVEHSQEWTTVIEFELEQPSDGGFAGSQRAFLAVLGSPPSAPWTAYIERRTFIDDLIEDGRQDFDVHGGSTAHQVRRCVSCPELRCLLVQPDHSRMPSHGDLVWPLAVVDPSWVRPTISDTSSSSAGAPPSYSLDEVSIRLSGLQPFEEDGPTAQAEGFRHDVVRLSDIMQLPMDSFGRPLNLRAAHLHDDTCARLCWWHRPPRNCIFGQLCDFCHHESHYERPRQQRRPRAAPAVRNTLASDRP